jgi:bifunctional DNA-binding transcriptional regulator/antitoxin component of YhaV-PrlF toxin-antitoxin module
MSIIITMTSKGQFTLPANVREAMKLRKQGDKLLLDFSPDEQQAILSTLKTTTKQESLDFDPNPWITRH